MVESSKDPGKTNEAALRRTFAAKCLDLIYQDGDGLAALDYAGKAVREMYPAFKEIIMSAAEFAEKELKRFEKEGDEKLLSRYSLLANYLHDRTQRFWK